MTQNANATGTVIPQQLQVSQPLYNVCTQRLNKHDTTRSERHTQACWPTQSTNGVFCLRFFFIYSIKVLAFYSFSEATVLELGQSKHSDVCGGWIDVCLVDGQLI